jgi:hypothetical protein
MTITPEREREEWEPVAWQGRLKPDGEWFQLYPENVERRRADPSCEVRPLYGPDLLSSYKARGEELERALARQAACDDVLGQLDALLRDLIKDRDGPHRVRVDGEWQEGPLAEAFVKAMIDTRVITQAARAALKGDV